MLRILCLLLAMSSLRAFADDLSIVDVRRNITLADEDMVYKDFYINAGAGSGLKKNLVVTAIRKISVRDASGSQAFGEILVPVGQLRIIAIYNKVAVAREYKLLSRDELPMLEQIGIMTGDKIDLQGSFVDNSKPKVKIKHKVSENLPAAMASTVALALTPAVVPPATAPATPIEANKGPAPASLPTAIAAPSTAPTAAPAQKLDKTANSGDNTAL